jgi:hypothetical protein
MIWQTGDILDIANSERCNVVAFTANSVLNKNGALVMGAGVAKRIRDHYPDIDAKLGSKITKKLGENNQADFHVAVQKVEDVFVVAVQVKRDWRDNGDWDLTVESLELLARYLSEYPHLKCVLNCPLIGLGGFGNQQDKVRKMVESVFENTDIIVCVK